MTFVVRVASSRPMSADHLPSIFDGELPLFEQKGRANGFTTWSARTFAEFLGYSSFDAFRPALKRAQQALLALDVDVQEHFQRETVTLPNGKVQEDVRLTRFACYLCAVNADPRKKKVAEAQAYFARYNEECQRFMDDSEMVDRVLQRDKISEHEKLLSATAKRAGVIEFGLFQNAGYRGLYNMDLAALRKRKAIPKERSPLDFMGSTELAANLFRLTQTEEKIKRDGVRGQLHLEETAEKVGKMVRKTMAEISGQKPEDLPAHEDIREVRKGLKHAAPIIQNNTAADLAEPAEPGSYLEPAEEREDPF